MLKYQNTKISKYQNIISKHQNINIKISKHQNVKTSNIKTSKHQTIYQNIKTSKHQNVKTSKYQIIKISKYQNIKISKYQNIKGIKISEDLKIELFGTKGTWEEQRSCAAKRTASAQTGASRGGCLHRWFGDKPLDTAILAVWFRLFIKRVQMQPFFSFFARSSSWPSGKKPEIRISGFQVILPCFFRSAVLPLLGSASSAPPTAAIPFTHSNVTPCNAAALRVHTSWAG